jgi:peptidoglycan/xylan/chitin deacetylase (PgdA/CDA1 family)
VTQVLITIDTELSALLFQRGVDADANYMASIEGRTAQGAFGIGWQMDCLEAHRLKGVFFVDPMPALVYGPDIIARIIEPIVARGHEVQLHIHTEWLAWAGHAPVKARGQNIADFAFEDQTLLIARARDLLVTAAAPAPIAFRAGNYGADDNTLRALAALGIAWDSSFNAAYRDAPCRIGLTDGAIDPLMHCGVKELPVGGIIDRPGHVRHAQICALSSHEMTAALDHAAETGRPAFVIVTHSFEMLSRDRQRPNRVVMDRFEALCRHVANRKTLTIAGFADLSGDLPDQPSGERLPSDRFRTFVRIAEQAVATLRYERL